MPGGIKWGGIGIGGGMPDGGGIMGPCFVGCCIAMGGGAVMGAGAAGSGMSSGGSAPPLPPPNGFKGIPIDLSLLVKLKEKIGTLVGNELSPTTFLKQIRQIMKPDVKQLKQIMFHFDFIIFTYRCLVM